MNGQNLNLSQRISKLATVKISSAPITGIVVFLLTLAVGLTLFVFNVFAAAGINIGPTPT